MKVLLDIKDSEAPGLLRVLESLPFVKAQTISSAKARLIEDSEKNDPPTTKDVALGIGRPLSEEELESYLMRTAGGVAKSASAVKRSLKQGITARLSEK